MKVEDVRAGISELNFKEINGEFVISDSIVNSSSNIFGRCYCFNS